MSGIRYIYDIGARDHTKPAAIEKRYCPKDEGHWRVDEPSGKCPVCGSEIQIARYELVAS